jgi:hypothetical protein
MSRHTADSITTDNRFIGSLLQPCSSEGFTAVYVRIKSEESSLDRAVAWRSEPRIARIFTEKKKKEAAFEVAHAAHCRPRWELCIDSSSVSSVKSVVPCFSFGSGIWRASVADSAGSRRPLASAPHALHNRFILAGLLKGRCRREAL